MRPGSLITKLALSDFFPRVGTPGPGYKYGGGVRAAATSGLSRFEPKLILLFVFCLSFSSLSSQLHSTQPLMNAHSAAVVA